MSCQQSESNADTIGPNDCELALLSGVIAPFLVSLPQRVAAFINCLANMWERHGTPID